MVADRINRVIATQLGMPRGVLGYVAGWAMNALNGPMNRFTVETLGIAPHHAVLDVGFGGGCALEQAVVEAHHGVTVGLEVSEVMCARARRRYRALIGANRMMILSGAAESIPFPEGHFDRVFSVNTLYFWQSPLRALAELSRVTKPGGRVALSFRPVDAMRELGFSRYGFTLYSSDEVRSLIRGTGFRDVELIERHDDELGYICAVMDKDR